MTIEERVEALELLMEKLLSVLEERPGDTRSLEECHAETAAKVRAAKDNGRLRA